jgi:hypothetical protein
LPGIPRMFENPLNRISLRLRHGPLSFAGHFLCRAATGLGAKRSVYGRIFLRQASPQRTPLAFPARIGTSPLPLLWRALKRCSPVYFGNGARRSYNGAPLLSA